MSAVCFIEYDFGIVLCSFFHFFFFFFIFQGRYIFPRLLPFPFSPSSLLFWVKTLAQSEAYGAGTFSVRWSRERRSDDRVTVERRRHGRDFWGALRWEREEENHKREGGIDDWTEREVVLCYTTQIYFIFPSLPLSLCLLFFYLYQYKKIRVINNISI